MTRANIKHPPLARLAALSAVVAVLGCAETQDQSSLLDYSKNAELLFQEAMDEFYDEDCLEAEKIFLDVRKQFPYSRYAVLSELHLADCQFNQDKHAEAAVSYNQFVKAHPTHEEAHYAAFRRGLSYYEMIPGDWIVTPPPHERDLSATKDTRAALNRFIETYPRSPYQEKARTLAIEVEDALVRHEMYVAEFYLSRDDRRAAAVRLEGVRADYPKSRLVPDAMFLQAVTFLKMNQLEDARRVFEEITVHFPDHHQTLRARDYLQHLDAAAQGHGAGGSDG